MLENGSGRPFGARDGWLNRVLQNLPDSGPATAYAVGRDPLDVLGGPAVTQRWSPETDLALSPQAIKLAQLIKIQLLKLALIAVN